jgi:hypothetical protein
MRPLNDDELNSLLEQAKRRPAQPSRELPARAWAAYHAHIARRQSWRSRLLQPISIPWPAAIVIASLLVVIGALIGRNVHDRPAMLQNHSPSAQNASNTSAIVLSLKEFQPVSEIKPRVVGEGTR